MGTNYYHRYNHCDCCGRYDERHIGKSMTMFQGYAEDGDWSKPIIASWQDWKRELLAGGKIIDEYGTEWPSHSFIAAVESQPIISRTRQYRWMCAHEHQIGLGHDWLCADDFSFTSSEFS